MTAYRFARVTGPQRPDGWWPGEAVEPEPDGDWSIVGQVALSTGNGIPPERGIVYPGHGRAWTVVVNPVLPTECATVPTSPDVYSRAGLLTVETDPTEDA